MLWSAVDVCDTYGNKSILPDVDHLAIAVLILEGAASQIVTSNWDGLIERAVAELSGLPAENTVGVMVTANDFREPSRSDIYKFHGCAVLACGDPANYRKLLVGRESQIGGWVGNRQQNGQMLDRLISIATTRKTLLLGLSGQDSNIKHVFSASADGMTWAWPSDPPACMLATPVLESDHKSILEYVYRAAYENGEGRQIEAACLIGAFSASVLLALAVYVLYAKLVALLDDLLRPCYVQAELDILHGGLTTLATLSAAAMTTEKLADVASLVEMHSHAMSLYLDGEPAGGVQYRPLGMAPVQRIKNDQFAEHAKLRGLAIALALLGLGEERQLWSLERPTLTDPRSASITARSSSGESRIFLLSNADAGLKLSLNGRVRENDADAILVYADTLPPEKVRSSVTTYGRTNRTFVRHVAIADLVAAGNTADTLLQALRQGAVL